MVDDLCVLPLGGPDSGESDSSETMADSGAMTGRSLIAFDAEDGSVRWIAGEDQISYASPMLMTLGGTRQIVSVNEATVTGHSVNDGTQLWEFLWDGQSNGGANCASAVQVDNDQFLVGKGYGGGSALVKIVPGKDKTDALAVWTSSSVLKTKFTHACVEGDVAYAISNGSLEAVSIPTGESIWRQPRNDRLGQGQLLLVEDILIGQSESGDVVFVDASPDEYKPRGKLEGLDTKTWNIPTLAGRHLLIRNDREVICYYLEGR